MGNVYVCLGNYTFLSTYDDCLYAVKLCTEWQLQKKLYSNVHLSHAYSLHRYILHVLKSRSCASSYLMEGSAYTAVIFLICLGLNLFLIDMTLLLYTKLKPNDLMFLHKSSVLNLQIVSFLVNNFYPSKLTKTHF